MRPTLTLEVTATIRQAQASALEELAPVTIFGAEHYAEPLQHLVRAGVPIRHPLTRRIGSVLDLACPTGDANGLLVPATLGVCAQIERELSMRAPERERVVFDVFVGPEQGHQRGADRSPRAVDADAAAADLLDSVTSPAWGSRQSNRSTSAGQ